VQSRFVANKDSQTGEPAFGMAISKRYGFVLAVLRVRPALVFPEGSAALRSKGIKTPLQLAEQR
jgi:hypothetical protein